MRFVTYMVSRYHWRHAHNFLGYGEMEDGDEPCHSLRLCLLLVLASTIDA